MIRFAIHTLVATCLGAALALSSAAVAAQQPAVTAKNVHLRAGPARDYPVVAILPAGIDVTVEGCLPDYSWCDVLAGLQRGWVYAGNLDFPWHDEYVPIRRYGPEIGIAIITFALFDYWSHHYRDRPWYRERDRWAHRPPPPAPPPRAIGPRPGPPPHARPPFESHPPPPAGLPRPPGIPPQHRPGGVQGPGFRGPGGREQPGNATRPPGGGTRGGHSPQGHARRPPTPPPGTRQ